MGEEGVKTMNMDNSFEEFVHEKNFSKRAFSWGGEWIKVFLLFLSAG